MTSHSSLYIALRLFHGSLGDLMDRLGNVAHVEWGERHHGDPAVLGHVDGKLVLEPLHLLRGHPGVAEHADLVGDVGPVTSGTCSSKGRRILP